MQGAPPSRWEQHRVAVTKCWKLCLSGLRESGEEHPYVCKDYRQLTVIGSMSDVMQAFMHHRMYPSSGGKSTEVYYSSRSAVDYKMTHVEVKE